MSFKDRFKSVMSSLRGSLNRQQATAETDPLRWFGNLYALPNPDPILREMGVAERVYHSIFVDAHVISEVRSMRGLFRSHQYRLVAGDEEDPRSVEAKDFCEAYLSAFRPNDIADWKDVLWQMSSAIFTGYHVHETPWMVYDGWDKRFQGKYLPEAILDRPGRRFKFNADGAPLLISNTNLFGELVDPYQFTITRHMPTTVNPYGIPLLSSCFWAWTFKTGGWRYFVKYCERHGLPWPFAKYPQGTTEGEQEELANALANMLEAGYVIAPDGTGLELLVPKGGGGSDLPQKELIDQCNREISKAITGQAMVGELHGVGSRAANETAHKRQNSVHAADRDIAVSGMGHIFHWMTVFNYGPEVAPPRLEFFKHEPAGLERAQAYGVAVDLGAKPSRKALLEELSIPEAEDDDDQLVRATGKPASPSTNPVAEPSSDGGDFSKYLGTVRGFSFAKAAGLTEDEAIELATRQADEAIERGMVKPIADMLARYEAEGKTLAEFKADLEDQIGMVLDTEGLREVIEQALSYSMLRGAATQVD